MAETKRPVSITLYITVSVHVDCHSFGYGQKIQTRLWSTSTVSISTRCGISFSVII